MILRGTPAVVLAVISLAGPVLAVMDINDRGPVLDAGRFALRITNIGVVGNAFFDHGLSFDPSFEYPKGSGHELLGHAELWVGAIAADGLHHVSGGPMLEWRPTLDPKDRVRIANAGDPGTRWNADNDGDGKVNEDPLNGIDDDGDGKVDEDFDLPAQQMAAAEYTDDRLEAVNYFYPEGERHFPLGLSVHQESYAWTREGMDAVAGLRFVVTNHGNQILHDLRMGIYANLDSRERNAPGGYQNNRLARVPYQLVLPQPDAVVFTGLARGGPGTWRKHCFLRIEGTTPTVYDSRAGSNLPCATIVPITHTTDPLSALVNSFIPGVRSAMAAARAPALDTTFHYSIFAQDMPPGQGGPPQLDSDRWSALQGLFPGAPENDVHDYAVLVSCGPFSQLGPGQSVEFSVALVAAPGLDSIPNRAIQARLLGRGSRYNAQPDVVTNPPHSFAVGQTGINGHEICFAPPPGITFQYDPNCARKFLTDPLLVKDEPSLWTIPGGEHDVTYAPGQCVWTDFDCDVCTGNDGVDLVHAWSLASLLPPRPVVQSRVGDGEATVEWDDGPEIALETGRVADPGFTFEGYKLYRLDNWTRSSLMPPPEQWQRIAVYRGQPTGADLPLAGITDSTLASDHLDHGFSHHPVGRYRVVDRGLHDGFDYHYVVTSIIANHHGNVAPSLFEEYESPFAGRFEDRVVPHAEAAINGPHAWVVPNPYRARSEWERPSVPGDIFTRHIDFMGLPRARCVIKIYTLAGDLVARLDHDGTNGDGEAPWNLISRNGQDIESGIYLFTIDSPLGHQVGRFVVIR